MIDPRLGQGFRYPSEVTTASSVESFERATGWVLPADCRDVILGFAGEGLSIGPEMVDLDVLVPRFHDPSMERGLGELFVVEVPPGTWVDKFLDRDGLQDVDETGLPAHAALVRRLPFLAEQPDWAVSLVPVMKSHSSSLSGFVCLDYSDHNSIPPLVFVKRGMFEEVNHERWDGIWYVAESITDLLAPEKVEEFDHEADSFPWENRLDDLVQSRQPSESELLWNQRRDERLGRDKS